MKVSGMEVAVAKGDSGLKTAYRTSFAAYSRKLEDLQRLVGNAADGAIDTGEVEAAVLEVEKARVAHSYARDQLARELVRSSPPGQFNEPRINEHQIRKTARLLWEIAGRPAGTAESDWRRAEQLVHAAASHC